jgi:pseudaminic acid cytidylyltransferase
MSAIAIIPARGGSKRIERKNIKDFNGKPVIAYTIQAALDSKLFDEVMVSTDDKEIAEVAKKYDASIPFMRSAANANDHATLADVLLEVMAEYKKNGKEFDTVCCILPTAALITQQRLKEGRKQLDSNSHTAIVPVLRFSYPIQRALRDDNGVLVLREKEHADTRSQDLEPFFHDSGQFYWIKTPALLQEKTLFTKQMGYIELKETEAQDVDTMLDWEMLKLKYEHLNTH